MRWWRRPRYMAVIVGEYSGNVSPVPFLGFRHECEAAEWCREINARRHSPVTHWEYRPIKPGEV